MTGCACVKDLAHVLGFDVASFPAIVGGCFSISFFFWWLALVFACWDLSVLDKETIVQ